MVGGIMVLAAARIFLPVEVSVTAAENMFTMKC